MIASFLIGIEVAVKKIGEEKYLQHGKHDEEFNQDDEP